MLFRFGLSILSRFRKANDCSEMTVTKWQSDRHGQLRQRKGRQAALFFNENDLYTETTNRSANNKTKKRKQLRQQSHKYKLKSDINQLENDNKTEKDHL